MLSAAIAAAVTGQHLICPAACGSEAACASAIDVIEASDLVSLLNYLKRLHILSPQSQNIFIRRVLAQIREI